MMYIKRHIEEKILEVSKAYSALLLTGARQTGKTTMLKELSKREGRNREYVSLDDLNEREMAKTDPAMFLQIHKPPVLIDEVQYAPELFTYIKIYVDKNHNAGDFWLTGSQIFRLMKGVQESLAGRVAVLHMSSLSQREICENSVRAFKLNLEELVKESKSVKPTDVNEIYERIWKGSMPGLVSGEYADRNLFYSSYVATYIERDVRELSGSIDALKFNKFITALAARTACLLNFNAVAEDADIDIQTAKSWVNVLETLGIIFLLYPYSNNVLKRTIKTPKVYFYDSGLVSYLTKWSSPEVLESGAMSGAILENYTVSEIIKSYQNAGEEPYLYFYRDKDNKEIDVILEGDGKLYPLEIKKTALPDRRIVRTFEVINKSPLKLGVGAVLCMVEQFGAFDKDNFIVPIWLI